MTTKAQQVKFIDRAFNALPNIEQGFSSMKEKLFQMNLDGEREHRRHQYGRAPKGFSAQAAARLFTIKHLAESLEAPDRYTVADILCIRAECLHAQAYANAHRAEILAAWTARGIDPAEIRAIDYAALMEG
jgi:hypothetical protein